MTEFYCRLVLRYWLEQKVPALREALLVDLDERLGLLEAARDLLVRFDGPEELKAIINGLTPVMIEIGSDVPEVRQALLVYLDERIELLEDVMVFANRSNSLKEIRVAIGFVLGEEESVMVLDRAA